MLLAIGAFMGLFALFPGASMATIPFLLGSYDLLFWQKEKKSYLLPILGFILGCALFSSLISSFMEVSSFRVYAYSFLTGFQLAAVRYLLKKIHYWKLTLFLFLSMGLLLSAFALPKMVGTELFHFSVFWQGCITAGSFFFPGFGVMNPAFFSFPSYLYFLLGMIMTLPLISFFFFNFWKNQREKALSFFLGLSLGSLPAIWPYSPFIHFIHQETIVHLTNQQMVMSFFLFLLGYFPIVKFQKWQKGNGKI